MSPHIQYPNTNKWNVSTNPRSKTQDFGALVQVYMPGEKNRAHEKVEQNTEFFRKYKYSSAVQCIKGRVQRWNEVSYDSQLNLSYLIRPIKKAQR